jgi:enoyl-CoA hydratase/carnithine racemase
MSGHIRIERNGGVLHLRLNRPDKRNALTLPMYAALAAALNSARNDRQTRVILLTAEGDAFSGGNDLQDFLAGPAAGELTDVLRFLEALTEVRVPMVAAVRGPAIGIGTTMLLHFDLVYAGRSARFQTPFVQLGLVPEAGSSLLLPARIGHARAARMLLLGEAMDAEEAAAVGLITEVVADDEVDAAARASAERLAALPPDAVRATRALMREAWTAALPAQMKEEAELFLRRLDSSEAREAIAAFFRR